MPDHVAPHTIFIDNCCWDFFYSHGVDLAHEFPPNQFSLWITREAEFEIPPIKVHAVREYAYRQIKAANVRTHSYFGFAEARHTAEDQRVGGWNQGFWIPANELDFIRRHKTKVGSVKKSTTRLYNEEADLSLAARSLNATVLTLDAKAGKPLAIAQQEGGNIVLLNCYDRALETLGDFVTARMAYRSGSPIFASDP